MVNPTKLFYYSYENKVKLYQLFVRHKLQKAKSLNKSRHFVNFTITCLRPIPVFAGKLDYQKYPFTDRLMIQLIMWMTKGPTNSKTKIEYTDWDKVKEFAVLINNI